MYAGPVFVYIYLFISVVCERCQWICYSSIALHVIHSVRY